MPNFDQGEFQFDEVGDESGYRRWQEDLERQKKEFEARYGIILGARVRVMLLDEDMPREGCLVLCDSKEPQHRSKLRLRIGKRSFTLAEMVALKRL